MIKRIITPLAIFAFLLVNLTAFAQSNTDFDQRLLAKFSEKELQEMNAKDLNYWNWAVSEGFFIRTIKKQDSDMGTIELENIELSSFNILEHGLEPTDEVQAYTINGTDKFIMVLSEDKVKALMKLK